MPSTRWTSIGTIIGENDRIVSDRLAIVAADGMFTYHDLDETVERVARGLAPERGDLAEARVAFLVPPAFAYVAVQRGIWRAGGVAVPLAVSHPPPELEHVIRDSGASIVVGSGRQAAALEAIAASTGARFLRTPDLLAGDLGSDLDFQQKPPRIKIRPQHRAMIVYTSGTTGKAKGVVTTHGQIAAQINSVVEAWEWSPRDCGLLVLPLHHVHGITVLAAALAVGASCEMLPQFEAVPTWDRLASGEVTVFSGVPTIYTKLIAAWESAPSAVQRAWSDGSRGVRLMMSGSAPLPVRTLDRWRAITGHTLLERYGMTETGMILSNPLHGERRPGSVGTPMPSVHVRLVDDEIEVRGPGVFTEYWRRPEETAAAFRDGWFRTGDVAVLEDGAYRLLGRRSTDIIKTGGFKVSALEIEEVLRGHPAIADCSVTGVPDEEWGERVSVSIELRNDNVISAEELRAWARERLAPYKVPRSVHIVQSLPRNAMGKILRQRRTS